MLQTHRSKRKGFSLVELVIVVVIIGVIGAIAIPRMTRAARNAGANSLKADLQTLRNALEQYAIEHDGNYPNAATGDALSDALTMYTKIDGSGATATKDSANGIVYGPYIKTVPPLPVGTNKGDATVAVGATPGTGSNGWIWDNTNKTIKANLASTEVDDDGVAYNTY